MDFIRFEILFRSKLFDNTFKKGIFPVLGSQKIIYKKPLKRWTKFKITISLEGWDDKWVYHSQTFKQKSEIYAVGYSKVAYWKNKKMTPHNLKYWYSSHTKAFPRLQSSFDQRVALQNICG